MNCGHIVVGLDFLKEILMLPDDAEILFIEQLGRDRIQRKFRVVVEHIDLPEVMEGAEPCYVEPMFITHYDKAGVIIKVEFDKWK